MLDKKQPGDRVLVKCGGFTTQLAHHVSERIDGHPLWGARFDDTHPEAVIQTHLDFLRNGAQIILSNTYQSSVEGFMKHLNLDRNESIALIRKSVRLTKQAKQMYLNELQEQIETISMDTDLPLVLASIGPYGAYLHDCSEYDGSYADRVTVKELQDWHRPRIDACLAEGIDGLAIETLPCQIESEALVDMMLHEYPGVKFWIVFTCKDGKSLAHGENFAEVVKLIWEQIQNHNAVNRLLGIGVNCLNPKLICSLFQSVQDLIGVTGSVPPLVVYSNRGETYDTALRDWTGHENCVPLESFVADWVRLGARIIGGCCRVYPQDILRIRKYINSISSNE